jgi:periplasmic glucans biosynthesis protein
MMAKATVGRRSVLAGLAAAFAVSVAPGALLAQQPAPAPPAAGQPPTQRFGFDLVVRRARELAAGPYEAHPAPLAEQLQRLDFDQWRDIRFRAERSVFGATPSPFRLQLFHLGFLFTRPVTVSTVREGMAAPIPYAANLFDFGRTRLERPLPVNAGFAGFRLHYPLNDPRVHDELISFVGASYFRFLGRGQKYGLSARGLSIGAGVRDGEEFPYFREFWIEQPAAGADRATIWALMDSPSLSAAFQFIIFPHRASTLSVTAHIFPRREIARLGLAPLTSMFFTGENDRRFFDDFRTEMHDSDGLLVHTGAGEWIWRPLRNPVEQAVSAFVDRNPRGFGLMQRDRVFEHYQDLDLNYELRPSYWVEPEGEWGEGHVELIEIPTTDETNDNIVALWAPRVPLAVGREHVIRYRVASMGDIDNLHPGGRAVNTFQAKPKALGSGEAVTPGARRFIIDFAGGELGFHIQEPDKVEIVPSVSAGRINRAFLVPNPKVEGFRAFIDVVMEPGQSGDLRAFLRAGSRTLTETWTYPWRAPAGT